MKVFCKENCDVIKTAQVFDLIGKIYRIMIIVLL